MDREAELILMDEDVSTCLVTFEQGRRFLRLVAFVYMPVTAYNLRVQLDLWDMSCTDPGLAVYEKLPVVGNIIKYIQCIPELHTDLNDDLTRCVYVCNHIHSCESVIEITVRLEKLAFGPAGGVKVCEFKIQDV